MFSLGTSWRKKKISRGGLGGTFGKLCCACGAATNILLLSNKITVCPKRKRVKPSNKSLHKHQHLGLLVACSSLPQLASTRDSPLQHTALWDGAESGAGMGHGDPWPCWGADMGHGLQGERLYSTAISVLRTQHIFPALKSLQK